MSLPWAARGLKIPYVVRSDWQSRGLTMAAALTCYKKLRIEPLLPKRECRLRYPGRKPLPDRQVLCGFLYVLHTDIPWEYLPRELGCGSGMMCWRRLRDWNEAGVWQRLHEVLLAELHAAGKLDWSRCVVGSSHGRALKGGSRRVRRRSTGPEWAPNIT